MSDILNLGCGVRPMAGAINHDRIKHSAWVDVAHNLDVLPWPWADEQFERIVALDVMEHLHCEVQQWLDECWRMLKPGGLLVLRLPAWDHECGHRDPTHVRLSHPNQFDYWDKESRVYEEYGRIYFQESNRWWHVESVESRDAGANWGFVLRKVVD